MNDDIGSERERFLEMRRQERIVNDEKRVICMRGIGERADVADAHHRIGRRFDEESTRFRADCCIDRVKI